MLEKAFKLYLNIIAASVIITVTDHLIRLIKIPPPIPQIFLSVLSIIFIIVFYLKILKNHSRKTIHYFMFMTFVPPFILTLIILYFNYNNFILNIIIRLTQGFILPLSELTEYIFNKSQNKNFSGLSTIFIFWFAVISEFFRDKSRDNDFLTFNR